MVICYAVSHYGTQYRACSLCIRSVLRRYAPILSSCQMHSRFRAKVAIFGSTTLQCRSMCQLYGSPVNSSVADSRNMQLVDSVIGRRATI
jgi:hypothetical protein